MKKLIIALALLLISTCSNRANSQEPITVDNVYILVCGTPSAQYFIRPSGILFVMSGVNGAPNCLMGIDTEGTRHVLCAVKESPERCVLTYPGPEI